VQELAGIGGLGHELAGGPESVYGGGLSLSLSESGLSHFPLCRELFRNYLKS
jgi:hypothetical protein